MNLSTIKNIATIVLPILVVVICGWLIYSKLTERETRFDDKLVLSKRWLEFNNVNIDHLEKREVVRGRVENLQKQEGGITFSINLASDLVSETAYITITGSDSIPQVKVVIPYDATVVPDGMLGSPLKLSTIDFGRETTITFDDFKERVENGSIVSLTYTNSDLNNTTKDALTRLALIDLQQ